MVKYRLFVIALFFAKLLSAQVASCSFELTNYDFESPDIRSKFGNDLVIVDEANIPGWKTTATDKNIEIWHSGFLGVSSYSGIQFAELNANQVAALYQDAITIPGTTLTYGFAHRGRDGVDAMELRIGPPDGPYVLQGTYSTGNTAWKYYTGTYVVPAGQTITRFYFSSLSSASTLNSVGNFLDAINIQSVNISMTVQSQPSCLGRIDIMSSAPAGVQLEYS
ncbi:MAG: hypothetical protein NT150_01735 [Bacteroidetes bacterium]|nr:hypothetical protein [Bacteroidota bacterium]